MKSTVRPMLSVGSSAASLPAQSGVPIGRSTPFAGAYLRLDEPDLGWGGGWFRRTNQMGCLEIAPTPLAP